MVRNENSHSPFPFQFLTHQKKKKVHFQDESREIASEYKGGLGRYAALDQIKSPKRDPAIEFSGSVASTTLMNQSSLPPIQASMQVTFPEVSNGMTAEHRDVSSHHGSHQHSLSLTNSESSFTVPQPPPTSYSNPDQIITPPGETRDYLTSPEEVLFMQVFVEEVGLWMDSMDPMKHVSKSQLHQFALSEN
jgi:hypothetical protein